MLFAPNHLRLKYDCGFDGAIASAGAIVKIVKRGGTPEFPNYLVEAFANTRLVAQKLIPDWMVEPIELLRSSYWQRLQLQNRIT